MNNDDVYKILILNEDSNYEKVLKELQDGALKHWSIDNSRIPPNLANEIFSYKSNSKKFKNLNIRFGFQDNSISLINIHDQDKFITYDSAIEYNNVLKKIYNSESYLKKHFKISK